MKTKFKCECKTAACDAVLELIDLVEEGDERLFSISIERSGPGKSVNVTPETMLEIARSMKKLAKKKIAKRDSKPDKKPTDKPADDAVDAMRFGFSSASAPFKKIYDPVWVNLFSKPMMLDATLEVAKQLAKEAGIVLTISKSGGEKNG